MIVFKLKYMTIPENNLKPIDYFYRIARTGERYEFETEHQVHNLIKEKFKEGWQFLHKEEQDDMSIVLYFVETKKGE